MNAARENLLLLGRTSFYQRNAGWKHWVEEYSEPTYPYKFFFHVRTADLDNNLDIPGVMPKREAWITDSDFPEVHSACRLSVGPLLAESTAEAILVAALHTTETADAEVLVGLFRIPRSLLVRNYEGEEIGEPRVGIIDVGDFSKWDAEMARVDGAVRLTFPPTHEIPRAHLFDFVSDKIVASLALSIQTHNFTDTDSPTPDSSTAQRALHSTLTSEPTSSSSRLRPDGQSIDGVSTPCMTSILTHFADTTETFLSDPIRSDSTCELSVYISHPLDTSPVFLYAYR